MTIIISDESCGSAIGLDENNTMWMIVVFRVRSEGWSLILWKPRNGWITGRQRERLCIRVDQEQHLVLRLYQLVRVMDLLMKFQRKDRWWLGFMFSCCETPKLHLVTVITTYVGLETETVYKLTGSVCGLDDGYCEGGGYRVWDGDIYVGIQGTSDFMFWLGHAYFCRKAPCMHLS